MRRLTAVLAATAVLFVGGAAIVPSAANAAKGGNSAAAKMCHKGGYAALAPSEDPTTAFVSEDACVSYAARGGTIAPYAPVVERTVSIAYTPTGVFPFCTVVVTLNGFEPNTVYTVDLYASGHGLYFLVGSPQTTTDANGNSTFSPFSYNQDFGFVAVVDGMTSDVFPNGC